MTVNNFMNSMADAETCYKKSLEISLKSFGKNAPFVARCNYNMGKLYQNQIRYMVILLNFKSYAIRKKCILHTYNSCF